MNGKADIKADYSRVDITWDGVSVAVPSRAESGSVIQILRDTSGSARSGNVTAVMGPSGAGKTTMMDLLAGRLHGAGRKAMTVTGDMHINGAPVDHRLFRSASAYVQQQDDLAPTESVREVLMFSAQLRLPGSLTHEDRKRRVEDILDELNLHSCADTLIGSPSAGIKGISGGEKRRVSVGMELITAPRCLFLDEPTSGLDSEIAVTIMQTLKSIAAGGRTVLLTLHQPNSDIVELFDDYILMTKGQVLYSGRWEDAVPTFAAAGFPCPQFKNPTDYFMRVASSQDPGVLSALAADQKARWVAAGAQTSFRKARAASGMLTLPAPPLGGADGAFAIEMEQPQALVAATGPGDKPASLAAQLWFLSLRQMRAWRRHPIMFLGEGVQYILLAAFVGGMYFDITTAAEAGTFDRGASAFFMLVTVAFTPPFTTTTVWQDERGLVRKEVAQNMYGVGVFFWSKTVTVMPIEAVFALLVSMVSYLMFDYQNDAGKFFIYFLFMVLTLYVSESIGLLFALVCKTGEMAIILMSLTFIILLSLTGFMTSSMPVYYDWVQYLSFLRYANAGIFINEMTGLTLTAADGSLVQGEALLEGHPLNNGLTVWQNVGVLASMVVFVRACAWAGIHLAHRQRWL